MKIVYLEDNLIDTLVFKKTISSIPHVSLMCYTQFDAIKNELENIDVIFSDNSLELENLFEKLPLVSQKPFAVVSSISKLEKDILENENFLGRIDKPVSRGCIKVILIWYKLLNSDKGFEKILEPDLNYLRNISGGDKTFEFNMLKIFQQELPNDIQNLKTALEAFQQDKNLALILHKVKSKLTIMGLIDLYTAVDTIETNIHNEKYTAQAKKITQLLYHCFQNLHKFITQELENRNQ